MSSIYYNDSSDNLHKVQRNGGPSVTELSYEDDDDVLHTFNIPTIQNIQFSQKKSVTSRNTIRGESRSQFGNISPATVTFDIKMNENLFNGLEELIVGNEIIVRKLTTEETEEVISNSTTDISEFVDGSESQFTIEQFIDALEDIKNNHRIFTLTTSSPLDRYLDNLAITSLTFVHDKNSREVVDCSIQAKIVKFTSVGWSIVAKEEFGDLTFVSEEVDDTNNALVYDYVQTDGQIRFNDNSTSRVISAVTGLSVEDRFGLLYNGIMRDYEGKILNIHEDHADYIEATDEIPLDIPGTTTIQFRAVSAYYGDFDETVDANGDARHYNINFPLINIEVKADKTAEWKPQFEFTTLHSGATGLRDNDISLRSALYNVYHEYEMDISTSVTAYISKRDVISEVQSGSKDWFSHYEPDPNSKSGNYQASKIGLSSYVWARDLGDMHSVYCYMDYPEGSKWNIVGRQVTGDFEFFSAIIPVKPEFDANFTPVGKEDRTEDVREAWGFTDPNQTVDIVIAGWMLGTRMKIFCFSRGMFGNQRRLVNTQGD